MKEKEIVILGLGDFGARAKAQFKTFFTERMELLSSQERNKLDVHFVDLDCKSSFDSARYQKAIVDAVENTYSRNNNLPFDFYLVGNLGETGVALQAVDLAYLLHVMDNAGILKIQDSSQAGSVISFFTFSDLVGNSAEYSEIQVSALVEFFEQSRANSSEKPYTPPYKDPHSRAYSPVYRSPFDKNYVFLTPGGENMIHEQTIHVLCERMFIEALVIDSRYKKNVLASQRNAQSSGQSFSSFCFYQVPRITELQKYMLRYTWQDFCLTQAQSASIIPSFEKALKEKFFAIFDLDQGKENTFPVDRMADVFIKRHASVFTGLIIPYIGEGNVENYLDKTLGNIVDALGHLDDVIFKFLRDEFDQARSVFTKGVAELFQTPALYGYFNYYRSFLGELLKNVEQWSETDITQDTADDKAVFDKKLEELKVALASLENNKLLQFPLLAPLKQEICSRLIQTLPFLRLIKAMLKTRLNEFLRRDYLDPSKNPDHPAHVLRELCTSLDSFTKSIQETQSTVRNKLTMIESMLDFHYVKTHQSPQDFRKSLERVKLKMFSETKRKELQGRYQKDVYNKWKESFAAKADFLHQEASFLKSIHDSSVRLHKSQEVASLVEVDKEARSQFCLKLETEIRQSLNRLADRSFKRAHGSIIREDYLIISPKLEGEDELGTRVLAMEEHGKRLNNDAHEENTVFTTDAEFSLGSEIFLMEMLFMPLEALNKWDRLKDYKNPNISEKAASNYAGKTEVQAIPQVETNSLSRKEKSLRLVIRDFLPSKIVFDLCASLGHTANEVNDVVINYLAKNITAEVLIQSLPDDDLRRVAREFDIVAGLDTDRTKKNIVHYLHSL